MARYVPGHGKLDANLVVVAEAPGAVEDSMGLPFQGPSGHLLDRCLADAGLPRQMVYITNVVKRMPKRGFDEFYLDTQRKKPSEMLVRAREEVREEVRKINPNCILLLGAEALKAFTGHASIEQWRGSIICTDHGKCVASYHPAYVLRFWNDKPVMQLDIQRGVDESKRPQAGLPEYRLHLDQGFHSTLGLLREIRPGATVAFDIETSGEHVRCLGFSHKEREAICVPFITSRGPEIGGRVINMTSEGGVHSHWSQEEEEEVLREVKRILEDPEIRLVAQNYPFDSTIIQRDFGIGCQGLWMDTMVAQHCCYPELPKSLDFMVSVYLRTPRYSDYNASHDGDTWRYNAMDAAVTWEISRVLDEELKSFDQWEFYRRHAEPTMVALARGQSRGVLVDLEMRKAMRDQATAEMEDRKKVFQKLVGGDVDPASPKQVQELLYGEYGIKPMRSHKTKSGITSGEKQLRQLAARASTRPEHAAVIYAVLDYRNRQKFVTSFLNTELRGDRYYTNYNATGARTGRISASTPLFGGGGNIQQSPKSEYRRMFIAPPGHVLLKVDLSQAEARFVAWDSKNEELIERFLNDVSFDIHVWSASLVYGVEESVVAKDQRSTGKIATHAGNYKITAKTASLQYQVDYATAELVLRRYHEGNKALGPWWDWVKEELGRTRTLTTPLGRQRTFFGRMDDTETWKSAIAYRPQSHVGDLINRAWFVLDAILDQEMCYPSIQIHDEIVFVVREDCLERVAPVIRRAMEPGIIVHEDLPELVIPSEFEVGPNWWDVTEYEVKT